MALVKTYQLQCEGPALARRLGLPFESVHISKTGIPYESAAKARRMAIKAGWSRVTRSLPILVSDSSLGNTDVAFDLCPSCTVCYRAAK